MYYNYKKISIILFFLSLFLILTDSSFEKSLRKSLWSLFNVTIEESGNISSNAPSSFFGFLEDARKDSVTFLDKQANVYSLKKEKENGLFSILFFLISIIFSIFAFLFNYVIIFYPTLIMFIYFIWTSRIFRRNNF